MKRFAILLVAAVGFCALLSAGTSHAQEGCAGCGMPRFRFGTMAGAAHGMGRPGGGLGFAVHNFLEMAEYRGELCRKLKEPEQPRGPVSGTYAYPYYTTRGPRDFLLNNPPTIGPY